MWTGKLGAWLTEYVTNCLFYLVFVVSEYEEDSEEESGKDWDELEEEAREGRSLSLSLSLSRTDTPEAVQHFHS